MGIKMCPYNCAQEHQEYIQEDTFNEEGERIGHSYKMKAKFTPLPCTGENCGAWHDGKCCYASVNLKNA